MADFDLTQLDTDLGAVCSPTYGGEACFYNGSSTTIYGVFTPEDAVLSFELDGRHDDRKIIVHFNASAVTPVEDANIYRPFDSTTYRITNSDRDLAGWICQLKKPY